MGGSCGRNREAVALMERFAQRTGLDSALPPRRYLWTDAFAVCNWLGFAAAEPDGGHLEHALRLVDQVHRALGRHRGDDGRSGWLSGLAWDEGERHPTRGGLRIGKPLPERGVGEPFEERDEWERDGQYFHYLTKWMHALDQTARATGEHRFSLWARELAAAAFQGFAYRPAYGETRRMYWKMSIDLGRPLVPSMGQHDPLDGYITLTQLLATANALTEGITGPDLEKEAREFAAMAHGTEWATSDPLGIGGLLVDAFRVQQLRGDFVPAVERLLERLLEDALTGLRHFVRSAELQAPARYRLAFRELGLAIGLEAVRRIHEPTGPQPLPVPAHSRQLLDALQAFHPVAEDIVSTWRDPANREAHTWREHEDINEVMLATSLVPDGFLVLRRVP